MNYYERSLELMRQSMELERRDIAQTFKVKLLTKKMVPERCVRRERELCGAKLIIIVRRGVSQLEISELEEQKLQAEQEVKQLQEALDKLQLQNGGRGWSSEQERK